jgi:general secretion pathway protein C
MNLLIDSKYIHLFWWILAPLLVAKLFLSIGAFFWNTNVFEPLHVNKTDKLHVYNFPKFYLQEDLGVKSTKRNYNKLKNIQLKACYIEGDKKFIIIEENKKTSFININEKYKGAKLIEVNSNYAIFEQNSEQIRVSIQEGKLENSSIKIQTINTINNKYISIRKADFKKYVKDPKDILKDIKVKEIIQNESFQGLEVVFLRKGSLFDKMNLKQGDIIKTINDKKISGTMSLIPHYSNLNNSSSLKIGIQRDKKMKEIV